MLRKETSKPVQESVQAPSSPVSQYQALWSADDTAPESELELTEDSVDFHSLLSRVSGDSPEEAVARDSDSSAAQKNLNISSVITRIRDEGPAASRADEKPLPAGKPEARQYPEENADVRLGESGGTARESELGKNLPPTVEEVTQLARAAAGELLATRFEKAELGKPNQAGWLFPVLFLCLLAAGGYALHKISSELTLAKAGIAQFSTRLSKMEETLSGLRRQISANASRIQVLYTPEKLREEMAAYRDQMREEMNQRLDMMALSVGQFPPVSARGESNDGAGNSNTVPKESKNPPSISQAPSVNETPRAGKADVVPGGRWDIYLVSYGTESQARKALEKYISQVPAATIQPARVRGKNVFRVTVPGFSTRKDATRYLAEIRTELGLKGSWVGRHVDAAEVQRMARHDSP